MLKRSVRYFVIGLFSTALVFSTPIVGLAGDENNPEQEPTAVGDGGAVATEHPEASKAAIGLLKKGGNAVDAAVAAAAVQGVTRPYSGGIGGGGIMHVYLEEEDRFVIIDHRSESSENFGPEAFVDPDTGLIESNDTRISSGMATAVPGAVKAWEEALEKYGTMSLHEVLQPAIKIANEGFIADSNFIRETTENADRFSMFDSTSAIYLDGNGNIPEVGTIMKNPDLAETYRLIAEYGSEIFYEGNIADAIIDTIHHPPVMKNSDHKVLAGDMTSDDLSGYEVITRDPIHVNYHGYDVYSSPPSSSGGVTLGETLNILEPYNLKDLSRTQALHYYMEASRYAFADRRAFLGDPNYTTNPVDGLLSKGFAEERRQNISDDRATVGQIGPGNPWPYQEDPDKQPDPPSDINPVFHYDFNGDDDGPWDSDAFYRLDTGPRVGPNDASFSLQQNTGRIVLNERKEGRGSAYGRAASNMRALEDSELLVRFRMDALGNDQRLRLWTQADTWGSGSTLPENGYGIELNAKTQQLVLKGRVNGSTKDFDHVKLDLSTEWQWLRLRSEGDQLKVRHWNDDSDEPSEWNMMHHLSESEKTDNGLGKVLMSVINFDYDSGNKFYFDDMTINDLTDENDTNVSKMGDNVRQSNTNDLKEDTEDASEESTIHLSVSDHDGNIVSYTNTIVSIGGNGMVVPGYGFLLNNALYGRTPYETPDHPNYPKPRYRSLSSMAPTIVMKDGKPIMTTGAPGSDTIITTVLQILINQLDFGMTMPEAIAEPRLTQRNNIDARTEYEKIYLNKYGTLISELEDMGHTFKPDSSIQGIGAATGLEFLSNNRVRAVAEPTRRGGGSAMTINVEDIEKPPGETTISNMIKIVEGFETEGEMDQDTSRLLKTHLISVEHYQDNEKMEKAIKHMKGFKGLLSHLKEDESISEDAFKTLNRNADNLINTWQEEL